MNMKPYDRQFTCPNGLVMKDGGSLFLTREQIGLFGVEDTSKNGLTAFYSLKGLPKDKKFVIRQGRGSNDQSRTGSDKDYSTPEFSLEDVIALNVSVPQRTKQSVDDIILGYNGIDPETSFSLEKGDLIPINIRLTGKWLGLIGYPMGVLNIMDYVDVKACKVVNPLIKDCAPCDPCEDVNCVEPILQTIERLRSKRIMGQYTLDDVIDITPVNGCYVAPTSPKTMVSWCMEVCDTGYDSLPLVQAQYPGYVVKLVGREGSISKYLLVAAQGYTPTSYKQTVASIIKGCDACPSSYTAVTGGLVYAVSLEDEGADLSSTVESLANAASGTAIKADGQVGGVGFYTVVLTKKLSKTDLDTFANSNPTSTVKFIASVSDICENSTVTTVSWNQCGTCEFIDDTYTLDIPDDDCGNNRLEELQAFYPDLVISLEGTAANCSTRYKTTTPTNVVCDECSDIFKDYFTSKAPEDFGVYKWVKSVVGTPGTNCLCGIRFRSKELIVDPGECLIDEMQYMEDSVRIQVSGGYSDMMPEVENFPVYDNPVSVYWMDQWAARTHVAGYLREWEKQNYTYFTGNDYRHNYQSRVFLNEESFITDGTKQVVDYELIIRPKRMVRLSEVSYNTISFHFMVLIGRNDDIEGLLNNIASAAGISPVKALA